ncbi:MAG: hypothetical protein AAF542_07320 [Pseudomonadota bacterium]
MPTAEQRLHFLSYFISNQFSTAQRTKEESAQFDRCVALYDKWLESYRASISDILISNEVEDPYLAPPFSPFDLFSLTTTLLQLSGAYHHFESSFESDNFPKHKEPRRPSKSVFVDSSDIRVWAGVADSWKVYDCSLDEAKPPFTKIRRQTEERTYGNSIRAQDNRIKKGITPYWVTLLNAWDEPIYKIIRDDGESEFPAWWWSAYSLMVVSDRASRGIGFQRSVEREDDSGKKPIWPLLAQTIVGTVNDVDPEPNEHVPKSVDIDRFKYVESLSIANRGFVNVMPKSRTAQLGCTLRRVSHNLASLPPSGIIKAGWAWGAKPNEIITQNPVFNMLLIPYPYEIRSANFKPIGRSGDSGVRSKAHERRWGEFTLNVGDEEHDGDSSLVKFISRLITESDRKVGTTHAVVLPELALSRKSIIDLRDKIIDKHPAIELLCAGVREDLKKVDEHGVPRSVNGAYMASLNVGDKNKMPHHEFFHEKHHRWRITEQQIDDYDLSPTLDPSCTWWEDLRVVNRRLPFLVMRDQWTVTSLICEDLARNDPARTVVESVGPNLVISLLMDGPQIPDRWSARYATVLAEDPGSSVLSMSSFGLIHRSNKKYKGENGDGQRSFALWRDDRGQSTPIVLEKDHHATTICLTVYPAVDYTMDGRADDGAIALRLSGQRKIKDPGDDVERGYKGLYPSWGETKEK